MTILKITQIVRNQVPQFSGRGLGPVFTRVFRGKKINRHAILRVYWNISVQPTQVGQSVVNVSIVEHPQRTHPAIIHWHRNIVFLHMLLLVGLNIERTKTVKPFIRKTDNQMKQCLQSQ